MSRGFPPFVENTDEMTSPASSSPAIVYLARISTGSRRTMLAALGRVGEVLEEKLGE